MLCITVIEKYKHFLVWEHIVSAHGAATALNRENPGFLFFSLFKLILCLPFNETHKHFHVWEHIASAHGAAMPLNRKSLGIFFLFVYINVCLTVHEKNEHFQR